MIKSSKTSLKFSNTGKMNILNRIIDEYTAVVKSFVDILWEMESVPKFIDKNITRKIDTWLSARMVQCAGKQASGIVRGTKKKQEKRLFVYNKLISEGKPRKAKKLKRIIDKNIISKPKIETLEMELDSRFVKINLENETSFDGWITLSSIGNKLKLKIPFRRNKHFNTLDSKGTLKEGIRLGRNTISFNFDIPVKIKNEKGIVIGIDVGQKNTISCSTGFSSVKDIHGHDLDTITNKLLRKQKGSKGFKKAQEHRQNYINWSINQLNLDEVKEVRIENIKNLRKGKRTSKKLSLWTYTDIFYKIEDYCNEHGVHVVKVNPTYTSKRCSVCGWTRSNNRKGKRFKCGHCGNIIDADLNASINIATPLKPIWFKQRQQYNIKKGFFWNIVGEDNIVPLVAQIN
jgi:IS605 OrfB family transposase